MANTARLPTERVDVALRASWEVEGCALSALAILNSRREGLDQTQVEASLRALFIRLASLGRTIMGALGEESESTSVLQARLKEGD